MSPDRKPNSKTTVPALDWHVCEDEREWQDTQSQLAAPLPAELQPPRWTGSKLRQWGASATCILLSLTLLGGWFWQRAQVGLAETDHELEMEIVAELWRDRDLHPTGEVAEANLLTTVELPSDPGEIVTQVQIRDLGSDWAVVEVSIQPTRGGPSYRQTRVYNDMGRGWVRGVITAAHWGAARQLESDYFIFRYRTLDEEAVMQAAPQLDALYPVLANGLFTQVLADEKLVIGVNPELVPETLYELDNLQADLVVASPSAALVPTEISTSDLLLQSLALELYNHFTISSSIDYGLLENWFRLRNALRLWLIWEHELPLAVWRKPVVEWILEVPEDTARQVSSHIPAFASELCLHHRLWMRSPLDVAVPMLCLHDYDGNVRARAWRSYETLVEISLGSLIYTSAVSTDYMSIWQGVEQRHMPNAVLLATVFEYIASGYGSEQIPRLLAAIPQHDQAETLIPAVFGVPLAEFERGWREYISENYAVGP